MLLTYDMCDDDLTQEDMDHEPFYGRCEGCFRKTKRDLGLAGIGGLPKGTYLALPPATQLYSPGCFCSYTNCWDEYLCADCATMVEKPDRVEEL